MPRNPFEQTKTDATLVTNITLASDKQESGHQEETMFSETNQAAGKHVAGKEDQNSDRYLVCLGTGELGINISLKKIIQRQGANKHFIKACRWWRIKSYL